MLIVALKAGASSPITQRREYAKNMINFLQRYTIHIIISYRDHLASCKMGDTAKCKAQGYEESCILSQVKKKVMSCAIWLVVSQFVVGSLIKC